MQTLSFQELVRGYLAQLEGRASHVVVVRLAKQWLLTLTEAPTRQEVIARHRAKGVGDFKPGCHTANKELSILRTIFRWGLYHEQWDGPNPTEGIRPWKIARRKRIFKFLELRTLLHAMDFAQTETERRDRALFGLMLFTGCRPGEARCVKREHVTAYGTMGCWLKPTTKTGEPQELPLPAQVMQWLYAAPVSKSPYYFPGELGQPLDESTVRKRWADWRASYHLTGIWTYDLRRTLATYIQSELKYPGAAAKAILNHYDSSAMGHYVHYPFDALSLIIQSYADWLFTLKEEARHVATAQPSLSFHVADDGAARVRTA